MTTVFRPDGDITLNKSINQLGILVLDGSGSMESPASGNVTIAKAVEGGLIEMFNRFNVSKKKQNFSFACIKFDNTVAVTLEPIAFDFNTLMNTNFDPREGREENGGTYTNLALEKAKEMAEYFLQNPPEPGITHRVLILLLSDGQSHEPQKTLEIATEIKKNLDIEIACAYFGTVGNNDPDAQTLLKEVASNATKFSTVYDGEALRNFFVASLSASAGMGKSDIS
jgi:uncharacterized protein YegL